MVDQPEKDFVSGAHACKTWAVFDFGGVLAGYLEQHPAAAVEVMLSDRYVDLLGEGIDVAIRIGRLLVSDLVARRLAPCRMVFCASPGFLNRYGTPGTVDELRQAPRLAFSTQYLAESTPLHRSSDCKFWIGAAVGPSSLD
jgi:DNA-binding transcriptional LysR family regulator